MATRKGGSIPIENIDSLLQVPDVHDEGITEIDIFALVEFKNHPFRVVDDEKMDELVASIKKNGVMTPIIVRPEHQTYGDKYELISGHRRAHAAKIAGLRMIPAIVKDIDDNEATIMMVDANIQREEILPSEKSKAYAMRYQAMRSQGKRSDIKNSGRPRLRADEELARISGESRGNVQRFLRLANLIPSLISLVDAKKLSIENGVELSFFSEDVQQWIAMYIRDKGMVRPEQVRELRKFRDDRKMTQERLFRILDDSRSIAPPRRKLVIYGTKLDKYFPAYMSQVEIEKVIFMLLDEWIENKKR